MNAFKIAIIALLSLTTPAVQGESDKPDCLITAMEYNQRLEGLTPWHMIVAMKIWDRSSGKSLIGHAVCVFKTDHDGAVYLMDASLGSVWLPTNEWDIYKIEDAINSRLKPSAHLFVYDIQIIPTVKTTQLPQKGG